MSGAGGSAGFGLRGRAACAVAVALALAMATAATAQAQPGSPDPSFGTGGVVTTSTAQLLGVAVQPDGEVVAAGQSGGDVFVERFTAAGAPAGSYTGPAGVARAVAIEPDGAIVIAGSSGGAMLVERLTASMTPDASFGSGGIALAFPGASGVANSVAIAPSGAIVAAGAVGTAPTTAAAAQFTSGGATSWAQNYGFGGNSTLAGVTVAASGEVVAVGDRNPLQPVDAVLALLNGASGAVDNATTYDYPSSGATAFAGVALQSDGEIVVGGQTFVSGEPAALFARYSSTGGLDTTFGSGGVVTLPASESLGVNAGGLIGAYGVGITGSGASEAIVGGGPFEDGGANVLSALWAVSPAGATESAFGTGQLPGTTLGPPQPGRTPNYDACAVAIAPYGSPDAGEIVTVGDTPPLPDTSPCKVGESANGFVASYTGDGSPPAPVTGTAPTAITGAASSITATSATIAGLVNPDGLATGFAFQYGTTTGYGQTTPLASAGSGSTAISVSAALTGLSPGTTYHYRVVASSADGSVNGADETFRTAAPTAPSSSTGTASQIGEISARVAGTINPGGLPTSYHFQYGKTTAYGSSTANATLAAASVAAAVSAHLTGLRPGTTYHYRLVAANADGVAVGADRKFTTAPRLRIKVKGVHRSYTIAAIEKSALAFTVSCNQPCSIRGSLEISAKTARQLGLGKRQLTLGTGTASRKRTGTASLKVRLSKKGKQDLGSRKQVSVTLQIAATPTGGGPRVVVSKTIGLTG